MKKFLLNNWPLLMIFLLSFLVTWPVFVQGYFSHHDDLQVMRIFEMRRCFEDLQIPCRWVPDMGFGYGIPLFNFYGPFAYYLGALFSYVLGYLGAAKALFLLPLVLGGVGMYLLGKEIFGKVPGFVAGALYLFAPYRALDAYVRGAVGESLALAIIPFVFYFAKKKQFFSFILALFVFLITHNIMTLLFTPLIATWALLSWKDIKRAVPALVLGFGLASFFLLPAFLEKNLVQTETLTRAELDFRSQFVKVGQLFVDRSWNYTGASPMSDNPISYQIGWPHWWLVVLAFGVFTLNKKRQHVFLVTFLLLLFSFAAYMTHNKSAPIWEAFKILAFVQFPWRFLSLVIFSASLLGGYVAFRMKSRWISIVIVILAILLNWQYFKPEHFYKNLTDEIKLSEQNFEDQQKGALLDYLPKTALEPRELPPKLENFMYRSDRWEYKVNLQEQTDIEVPVFYFPGWKVNYPYSINSIGRIVAALPIGEHLVIGRFTNTPIRTLGNIITIISGLWLMIIYAKNKQSLAK